MNPSSQEFQMKYRGGLERSAVAFRRAVTPAGSIFSIGKTLKGATKGAIQPIAASPLSQPSAANQYRIRGCIECAHLDSN
jgi:hypothetical protein